MVKLAHGLLILFFKYYENNQLEEDYNYQNSGHYRSVFYLKHDCPRILQFIDGG
jgi:hypothetical protein